MSDSYEEKRDAACPRDLNMYCDDVRCGASKFWKAGADWARAQCDENERFYRNEWENACERVSYAQEERDELKAKLEIANKEIERLKNLCDI